MLVSHIERIPTEQAAFLHGSLADTHVIVLTPIEQPEIPRIAVTPDWERVSFFAADGEGVIYTPGVPDFF